MATGDVVVHELEDGGGFMEKTVPSHGSILLGITVTDTPYEIQPEDIGTLVICDNPADISIVIPEATLKVGKVVGFLPIQDGKVTLEVSNINSQIINNACNSAGTDCILALLCLDDTPNAEVYKAIGGIA